MTCIGWHWHRGQWQRVSLGFDLVRVFATADPGAPKGMKPSPGDDRRTPTAQDPKEQ
jgi:hypothetical protein